MVEPLGNPEEPMPDLTALVQGLHRKLDKIQDKINAIESLVEDTEARLAELELPYNSL